MSQKFGRNYSLLISRNSSGSNITDTITINPPFTLEFDIIRNTLTSANICSIRLYNLSANNRNALRRNVSSGWSEPFINVVLRAGYGTNLPIVFSGDVNEAWSVREGVNYVTELKCLDAGFAYVNAQTNLTIPSGTPYRSVIATLINSMATYVTLGAIDPAYKGNTPKQISLTGNPIDILNQLTGYGFFIDNGVGNALTNGSYTLAYPIFTVSPASGLLNIPIIENGVVRFEMIFEPQLNIGAGIQLTSFKNAIFNGSYIVSAIHHKGIISETVCGEAITTGEFVFFKNPVGVQPNAS